MSTEKKLPLGFSEQDMRGVVGLKPRTVETGAQQADCLRNAFHWPAVAYPCLMESWLRGWQTLYNQMQTSSDPLDLSVTHPKVYQWMLECLGRHAVQSPPSAERVTLQSILRSDPDYLRRAITRSTYSLSALRKLMQSDYQTIQMPSDEELSRELRPLQEELLAEVKGWFAGKGRCLETGPERVSCWIFVDESGYFFIRQTGVSLLQMLPLQLALHIILANDVLNLIQENKVLVLHNLLLGMSD